MKFLKTLIVTATIGLVPSLSQAGSPFLGPSGFLCKEYDLETGKWGEVKLAVKFGVGPHGTDVTKVATPEGESTFYTEYKQNTTPHYRWGYADHFETVLISPDHDAPFGKMSIDIEHQGPTYKPDGEYGYYVRGISGYLKFAGNDGSEKKAIYLSCKGTK